jgi:hypothetical protein
MSDDNNVLIDPKIQELLEKLGKSRDELTKYMDDVEKIRLKVDQIFPQGQDFRNKWVLEEKIKAVSSFYSTLLNIRQEFNKTIKEEIEVRRKIEAGDEDGDSNIDVRSLAKMIEEQQKSDAKSEGPVLKLQAGSKEL